MKNRNITPSFFRYLVCPALLFCAALPAGSANGPPNLRASGPEPKKTKPDFIILTDSTKIPCRIQGKYRGRLIAYSPNRSTLRSFALSKINKLVYGCGKTERINELKKKAAGASGCRFAWPGWRDLPAAELAGSAKEKAASKKPAGPSPHNKKTSSSDSEHEQYLASLLPKTGFLLDYEKKVWPEPERLLIWAYPGESGGRKGRRTEHDVTSPSCWVDANGKHPEKVVMDEKTDLLFLPAGEPYRVGTRHTPIREICRHVTCERNAGFVGGGDGRGRNIYGNVWIRTGAGMDAQGATRLNGPDHTFFRNDNTVETSRHTGRGGGLMCSQYFTFNKTGDASVEFIGYVTMLDEFKLYKGTVIVAPGSTLKPGRNATPRIEEGAKLVLLSGSYYGKWLNEFHGACDLKLKGVVQAGLPDRPLTEDAVLGLSFRNWQAKDFSKWFHRKYDKYTNGRRVTMMVHEGAKLRSITDDPEKACLVVRWNGIEDHIGRVGRRNSESERRRGEFNDPAFTRLFDLIPRKLTVFFFENAMVDMVRFEDLAPGGLILENMKTKQSWNILFGENNMAEGSRLFQQMDYIHLRRPDKETGKLPDGIDKGGRY